MAWSRLRTAQSPSDARLALESLVHRISSSAEAIPPDARALRPLAGHLAQPATAVEAAMVLHALCARPDAASLVVRGGFVAPLCDAANNPDEGEDALALRGWALAALAALAHATAGRPVAQKLPDACLPTLIGALHRAATDECRAWAADGIALLVRSNSAATAMAIRLGAVARLARVLGAAAGVAFAPDELTHREAGAKAALGALGEIVQLSVGRARLLRPSSLHDNPHATEAEADAAPLVVDSAVALLLAPTLAPAAGAFLKHLCSMGGAPAARAVLLTPGLPAAVPLLLSAAADPEDYEAMVAANAPRASSSCAHHPAAPVRALVISVTAQLLSTASVAHSFANAATRSQTADAPSTTAPSIPAALRALRRTARDVHERTAASRHPAHRASAVLLETLLSAIDIELTRVTSGQPTSAFPTSTSAPPIAHSVATPAAFAALVAPTPRPAHPPPAAYLAPAAYEPSPAAALPLPPRLAFSAHASAELAVPPPQPARFSAPPYDRPRAPPPPTSAMAAAAWATPGAAPTAALASAALYRSESHQQRTGIELAMLGRALNGCEERAALCAADAAASREEARAANGRCEAMSKAARDAERRASAAEGALAAANAAEERAVDALAAAERRGAHAERASAARAQTARAEAEKRREAEVSDAVQKAVRVAEAAAKKATAATVAAAEAAATEAAAESTATAVARAVEAAVADARAEAREEAARKQSAAIAEAQRVHTSAMAAALEHTRSKHAEELRQAGERARAAAADEASTRVMAEDAASAKQEVEARAYAQVREARKAAEAACRSAADAHARARASEVAREEAAGEHARMLAYLGDELETTRSALRNVEAAAERSDVAAQARADKATAERAAAVDAARSVAIDALAAAAAAAPERARAAIIAPPPAPTPLVARSSSMGRVGGGVRTPQPTRARSDSSLVEIYEDATAPAAAPVAAAAGGVHTPSRQGAVEARAPPHSAPGAGRHPERAVQHKLMRVLQSDSESMRQQLKQLRASSDELDARAARGVPANGA